MTSYGEEDLERSIPYRTPAAFRQALTQRIADAADSSGLTVSEIRRQFVFGRFLFRVFAAGDTQWVLKGATGLLARVPNQARHSLDIDLMRRDEMAKAVTLLQHLGGEHASEDFFTFDLSERRAPAPDAPNTVLSAVAYLGEREFERFKIDLVVESNMTAQPEIVDPLSPVEVPGLPSTSYRVYPLVDHIADKHAAMLATYNGRPSTRYRDLVDLAIVAGSQSMDAKTLSTALRSEYAYRGLQAPTAVTLPSDEWIAGYERAARNVANLQQRTAHEALELVGTLLNPILSGRRTGTWDHEQAAWTE